MFLWYILDVKASQNKPPVIESLHQMFTGGEPTYTFWEIGKISMEKSQFPMDFLPNCSQKFPIIPNNKSKFRIKCSLCSQIISHHLVDLYPSLSKRYLTFCSVVEPVLNLSQIFFPIVPKSSQLFPIRKVNFA